MASCLATPPWVCAAFCAPSASSAFCCKLLVLHLPQLPRLPAVSCRSLNCSIRLKFRAPSVPHVLFVTERQASVALKTAPGGTNALGACKSAGRVRNAVACFGPSYRAPWVIRRCLCRCHCSDTVLVVNSELLLGSKVCLGLHHHQP
jgi:hypothetical protein